MTTYDNNRTSVSDAQYDSGVDRTLTDLVGICAHWNTEGPREPEIRQLQVVILVDQQVLRFQVSVKDPVGVAIIETSI